VQIGNCGSPIDLDEDWLLFTNRVAPVRKYSVGAVLLDKADPSRVLARSCAPPKREGYVTHVVYTCGDSRHAERIILPYAVSDTSSHFATTRISPLMQAMTR